MACPHGRARSHELCTNARCEECAHPPATWPRCLGWHGMVSRQPPTGPHAVSPCNHIGHMFVRLDELVRSSSKRRGEVDCTIATLGHLSTSFTARAGAVLAGRPRIMARLDPSPPRRGERGVRAARPAAGPSRGWLWGLLMFIPPTPAAVDGAAAVKTTAVSTKGKGLAVFTLVRGGASAADYEMFINSRQCLLESMPTVIQYDDVAFHEGTGPQTMQLMLQKRL